jgi:TPR repeat protein
VGKNPVVCKVRKMKHNLSIVKFLLLLMFMGSRENVLAQSIPKLPVKPVQKPIGQPVKKTTPQTTTNPSQAKQVVKFISDATGILYIDAERVGVLEPEIPLRVSLGRGEYELKIVSVQYTENVIRETIEVKTSGEESIHRIRMGDLSIFRAKRALELLTEARKFDGDDKQNFEHAKAFELYLKSAELGNADAMFSVGYFYHSGRGVLQDFKKAMDWYLKSANLGNNWAMKNIGYMYHNGESVDLNYEIALEWYLKAAKLDNPWANFSIGFIHHFGQGVKPDYEKAMQYYTKASNLGNPWAPKNIGDLYMNGQGVSQDYIKARQWYGLAAERGDANSMNLIGMLFKEGKGVPKDLEKAKEWFKKSCDGGWQDGCTQLKNLQ